MKFVKYVALLWVFLVFSKIGIMAILARECSYFRVFILGKDHEFPWFGCVPEKELKEVFHIKCDVCMHYFKEILGSTTLYLAQPQDLFQSHILSYFFTYITNLLQNLSMVEGIIDKLGFGNFLGMGVIRSTLCKYEIEVCVTLCRGAWFFARQR